jgi:phosphatidate cytidylyltransferase
MTRDDYIRGVGSTPRIRPATQNPGIPIRSMLVYRMATGLALIGGFLAILVLDELWFAPWYPLWFLCCLVFVGLAAREMIGLLAATTARPSVFCVYGGTLAILVANWVPHFEHALSAGAPESIAQIVHTRGPVESLGWPFLVYVGVVMVAFVIQALQYERPGRVISVLAGTCLALTYVGLLASFVIQLRWVDGKFHGLFALLTFMATAKGADTGAYVLGRVAGRTKLWPRLSPNKTVEGAVGGLVLAVVAALVIKAVATAPKFEESTLGWLETIGFGLVVGVVAQLGDLMESMIKRDCERKDASDTLPGFGGVLDVLDSLLFAAPVALGYWLLFSP